MKGQVMKKGHIILIVDFTVMSDWGGIGVSL
jgi:hypothetical protein